MNDREFAVIASRLVWGEREVEVNHQDTLKRLKALLEERQHLVDTFKDVAEPHEGHVKLPVLSSADLREAGATLVAPEASESQPFPKPYDDSEGRV